MIHEITGGYKVAYHPVEDDPERVFEVDWSPPFKRVYMIPELEKALNVTFPPASDFAKPGVRVSMLLHCVQLNRFFALLFSMRFSS